MRNCKIRSLSNFQIHTWYSIFNYSHHGLHYIPGLIYLTTGSLYLLIIFTHIIHPPPTPSGNHSSVPCIYEFFVCLFCLRFHIQVRSYGVCLHLSDRVQACGEGCWTGVGTWSRGASSLCDASGREPGRWVPCPPSPLSLQSLSDTHIDGNCGSQAAGGSLVPSTQGLLLHRAGWGRVRWLCRARQMESSTAPTSVTTHVWIWFTSLMGIYIHVQ